MTFEEQALLPSSDLPHVLTHPYTRFVLRSTLCVGTSCCPTLGSIDNYAVTYVDPLINFYPFHLNMICELTRFKFKVVKTGNTLVKRFHIDF